METQRATLQAQHAQALEAALQAERHSQPIHSPFTAHSALSQPFHSPFTQNNWLQAERQVGRAGRGPYLGYISAISRLYLAQAELAAAQAVK